MALMITKDCFICGACESECPNNAIYAGEAVYEINPNLCT
ncbi:MAG: ferredoxin, partial [Ignavibacteriae bacterium]